MVVLAARRAANTGREVIVVTSDESSDDLLAHTLASHGVRHARGSLNHTLKRFVDALQGQDDERIVFRLTSDNVFPDGQLLDAMEEDYRHRGLDYLACNGLPSGLPYGVSAEVMRVKHLRQALAHSTSSFDHEHVTPWIIRKFGSAHFTRYAHLDMGMYRSTIDTLSDYLRIAPLLNDPADCATVPLLTLLERLSRLPDAPALKQPASKLVVGTAQFGLDYGIANTSGQSTAEECQTILSKAIANGASWIDTAHAYGNSEISVGRALHAQGLQSRCNLVTKLSPLVDCPADASAATLSAFVDASVYASIHALQTPALPVLLLHRASHLDDWEGMAWKRLRQIKADGLIQRLGVSVQTPEELRRALQEPDVSFIQLPFNLLDWRWDSAQTLVNQAKASRQLTIHARSALLQGLLLSSSSNHWQQAHCPQPDSVLTWLSRQVCAANRASVADLALAWVRSQEWIDGVVVGMERLEQLDDNLRHFDTPLLSNTEKQAISKSRPRLDEKTLNPAFWKARSR